jgi:xylulose-5-phosphate/fructose-6-phosphate phosphoketolase
LESVNYVNVILADKQVHLQYLDMEAAIEHCTKGVGIWSWACDDQGTEPDVVWRVAVIAQRWSRWPQQLCFGDTYPT